MADQAVTIAARFLLENLLHLITKNAKLIAGAEGDFQQLLEEVQRLIAFLEDAAKYHSSDMSSKWKQLVKDVRIIVHRAEDVLDKFVVQTKLHEEKNVLGKFLHQFGGCHVKKVRELAKEIKGIHEKVKEIRQNNQQAFQTSPLLDLSKKDAREPQDPLLDDNEVIGFDLEAEILINRLIKGSEDLCVVPILGMAGLGKTTLARKVYSDLNVSTEFSNNIWIYVGPSYKLKDVLLKILIRFTEQIEQYQSKDVNEIAKVIRGFMAKEDKCLIVLDDVSAIEVVDYVKRVFLKNNRGHRIMMTATDRYIASYANANPHSLKYLTKEESFLLLEKRVFGCGTCPDELVEHGKNIAGKCTGLPLALLVISGALRVRPSKKNWARIEKNIGQHLVIRDDPSSCWKIVEMSYNSLSQEMKACFLYCFAFPRGHYIPAWKLICLWIAEGLIKSSPVYTLEEIAESYLEEFEERNLVTVMRKSYDGQIKELKFSDIYYEFYKMEATKESVFQEVCLTPDLMLPTIQDPATSRRLCIESSTLLDLISTKPYAEHVRSFLCFSTEEKQGELSSLDVQLILKAFPLIRVLEIESLKFSFSKYFNHLFHLTYIAISGDFKELPTSFGKFWNLQTLIVNTSSTLETTLNIKANIWNMSRLRHLHTNIPAKLPPPPTPISKGSYLQTLSKVVSESCNKDVFAKACNLKKLSIQGEMVSFLETNKGGFSDLQGLERLENLKLLNNAHYLSKALYLPQALFRFLRTLKKLTLSNTRFGWSEANKLGQLECLEYLKLKEYAIIGKSWKPEIGGFSLLQVLWIETTDLECWEASRLHFPKLRNLVLLHCDMLRHVPDELHIVLRGRTSRN